MTLRLTVRRSAWEAHVRQDAAAIDGLLPVVKGNGYGFGRAELLPRAAGLAAGLGDDDPAPCVCVGTVHELDVVPDGVRPLVLTPSLSPPTHPTAVLTVGATEHVHALAPSRGSWSGQVVVKVESSMHRFGIDASRVVALVGAAVDAGLRVVAASMHLPIAGSDESRRDEIERAIAQLPDGLPLSVSHLDHAAFAALAAAHPRRVLRLRRGTALWHGDKSMLHLDATVLDVRRVRNGDVAGYHATPVEHDGHLVAVAAGSAHGVAPLPDGRSPFHYARERLILLEPPHMHTSLAVVPDGRPLPSIGDRVDVQRPLISTLVDEIDWQP